MKRKKLLLSFIVIVVFLMIATLGLYYLVDLNSHKPRIETALSNALGLDVRIKGNIGFVLFPNLHISIGDIKITGKEWDIASLEKVKFGLKLLPLLKGRFSIDKIDIKRPEISFVRFRNGEFNVRQKIPKKTKEEEKDTPQFTANIIALSDGVIIFTDRKNGTVTQLRGIDIAIKNLILRNRKKQSLIHDLSFNGRLHSKKITSHDVEVSDLTFHISAQEGLYTISDISTTLFSGKGKGEVTYDVTGKTPSLKIQSTLSQFRLEEFLHALSEKKSMEGEVNFSMNLSMQGNSMDEKKKTMNGHIAIQGENLVMSNYDIDTILSNYRKTQNIGALDIGAFFLAGPVGTTVTKGVEYGAFYSGAGAKQGIMKQLVSDWKVEKGIAEAEDVAFSTRENRLAVKGNLDFINDKYENVIVALIDAKGCAELTQKIHGSLNDPQFEKTSVLQSAAGSVLSIIGKAGKLIPGAQCEAFYNGSVQHP